MLLTFQDLVLLEKQIQQRTGILQQLFAETDLSVQLKLQGTGWKKPN